MATSYFKKPNLSLNPALDLDSTLAMTYQLEKPLGPLAENLEIDLEDIALAAKSKANPVKEALRLFMRIRNHQNKIKELAEQKEKVRQLIVEAKEVFQQLELRGLYLDTPNFAKLEDKLDGRA